MEKRNHEMGNRAGLSQSSNRPCSISPCGWSSDVRSSPQFRKSSQVQVMDLHSGRIGTLLALLMVQHGWRSSFSLSPPVHRKASHRPPACLQWAEVAHGPGCYLGFASFLNSSVNAVIDHFSMSVHCGFTKAPLSQRNIGPA